jgi:hypothetical protein
MKKYFITLLVASFTGISFAQDLKKIEFGQEFKLPFNETAIIKDAKTGTTLKVKFNKVLSDNRCPANVSCVIAGEVEMELLINEKDKITIKSSTLQVDVSKEFKYKNYKFNLLSVSPKSNIDSKIPNTSYIATLKFYN